MRPTFKHTATDTTLERAAPAPLAEVRSTKTAPAAPLAPAKTASALDTSRLALFAKSSHPDRPLAPDALAGVRRVAVLLHHAEGLKLYYYEDANVGLHIASHGSQDADAMRNKSAGKVGEHTDLLGSLKSVRNSEAKAAAAKLGAAPGSAPQPKSHNVFMLLTRAGMLGRAKKLSDEAGNPILQGGTRLRFGDGGKSLLLEPSGNYGYMAPSPKAVEQMATFYANVLRHGDTAHDPAVRCQVPPIGSAMVHLSAAEMGRDLQVLADAINAKLAASA